MVPLGPGCKLVRREPGKARVRAAAVVVVPPVGQQLAGVAERAEHRLVQQFVAQPAVISIYRCYGLQWV